MTLFARYFRIVGGGRDGRALLAGADARCRIPGYAGDPLTTTAIGDLRAIGFGRFTPATLFRGETAEDYRGPFDSQFLLRDIPYGLKTVDQRFRVPTRGQSYFITFDAWVACQRGAGPRSQLRLDDEPRYIASYRELVEFVH